MHTEDASHLPSPDICRWCAALFLAPPDAEGLALYRSIAGRALLDAVSARPGFDEVAAELRAATAPGADLTAAARRISAAHSSAFLTAKRRSAPPYASFWLSDRGMLFQEPARAMNRLMAAAGVVPGDGVCEAPDHVGLQLNFLAEMIARTHAGETVPISPAGFLRDHMLTWLPDFARACVNLPDPFFYGPLARGLTLALEDTRSPRETPDTTEYTEAS